MNIVQTLVAVALITAVTIGGVQYINADAQTRARLSGMAEAGFLALDSAFRARQAAGLSAPAADGWEAALFPAFGTRPNAPRDLAWSYGIDGSGTWFCLSGTPADRVTRDALDRLKARLPDGLYAVGGACGGREGAAGAVAATYWVVKTAS